MIIKRSSWHYRFNSVITGDVYISDRTLYKYLITTLSSISKVLILSFITMLLAYCIGEILTYNMCLSHWVTMLTGLSVLLVITLLIFSPILYDIISEYLTNVVDNSKYSNKIDNALKYLMEKKLKISPIVTFED